MSTQIYTERLKIITETISALTAAEEWAQDELDDHSHPMSAANSVLAALQIMEPYRIDVIPRFLIQAGALFEHRPVAQALFIAKTQLTGLRGTAHSYTLPIYSLELNAQRALAHINAAIAALGINFDIDANTHDQRSRPTVHVEFR